MTPYIAGRDRVAGARVTPLNAGLAEYFGNARGVRHCVPFLTKGDEIACPLRAPAFAAVELVGKAGVPWLIQGLGTESTNLWCWQALYNITGENRGRKGESIRRWSEWWNENR